MGSSGSKNINPKHLKDLLESSQKTFKTYITEKNDTISHIKEEIEKYLQSKDINSLKEKMKKFLSEEDDITIYDILNRIVQTLKEKVTSLSENKNCPNELKAPLNTVIYAAPKLEIKELKEFRDIFKNKYGSNYISKVDKDEENLINEVLIEKLKERIYSERLIKARLIIICEEKKIDSQFLDEININNSNNNQASSQIDNSSSLRKSNITNTYLFSFKNLDVNLEESKNIKMSKNEDDNSDKLSEEFKEIEKNDPFKRLKTVDEEIDKRLIIEEETKLFSSFNENIDKKCYEINHIENWAESFYNIKTGIILDKYKELLSKSEFNKFFEALNYEYGLNNCQIDLKKAFDIYKNAADNTTDTLSMYRLYHIYKRDYKKFNIKERSHVLEQFYIMKCFSYLTILEKKTGLFQRFDIILEIKELIMDENKIFYKWYAEYFEFLQRNYSYYDLKKDDIILIEVVMCYCFEKKSDSRTEEMKDKFFELIEKDNPHAIYNLLFICPDEKDYYKYYEKLYDMNYYRAFADCAKTLPNEEKTLTFLKKSISNGYINHIKEYLKIFMLNNEMEDIVKSPKLKSELIFIINNLIDNIILDDLDFITDLLSARKILIKNYNLEEELKQYSDIYFKEIINYINKLVKGNDDENKKIISKYFNKYYFSVVYTIYGSICFWGVKGIFEKNYNETLNKYNYLLQKDDGHLIDRFYLYYIYLIKNKQRKLNKENKEDKDLIELEKKLLNLFYNDISVEKIKTYPPSFFYSLSRLYRNNTIKTKDLILEYVFLHRASNAKIDNDLKNVDSYIFEEKYYKEKAKKKIKEKDKEENFKKIKEGKGAINVEGYGEDGMICPICLENKKSIIALPCKHFFCSFCMNKLLDDGYCPICRTEIKITFDFNSKKESLIKSKIALLNDDNSLDYDDIPYDRASAD